MDQVPEFIKKNKQMAPKVIDYSVEEDGIFVSLNRHWCFDPQEHTRSFDKKCEAIAAIKAAYPCKCSDCETGQNW